VRYTHLTIKNVSQTQFPFFIEFAENDCNKHALILENQRIRILTFPLGKPEKQKSFLDKLLSIVQQLLQKVRRFKCIGKKNKTYS